MGDITKSLATNIADALNATPGANDLFPYSPTPGIPYVTPIKNATVAQIIAGGGGALDIGLKQTAPLILNDAQIKALKTTPQLLLAGVANTYVIPLQVVIEIDCSAGSYTGMDTTAELEVLTRTTQWEMCWPIRNDNFNSITDLTAFLTAGNSPQVYLFLSPWLINFVDVPDTTAFPTLNGTTVPTSEFYGHDILLSLNNSVDLGGGNVANRMAVRMLYWSMPKML